MAAEDGELVVGTIAVLGGIVGVIVVLSLPDDLATPLRHLWDFLRKPNVCRGIFRVSLVCSGLWSAFIVWMVPFPLSSYLTNRLFLEYGAFPGRECKIVPCLLGVFLYSTRGVLLLILAPWLVTAAITVVAWVRRGFQSTTADPKITPVPPTAPSPIAQPTERESD